MKSKHISNAGLKSFEDIPAEDYKEHFIQTLDDMPSEQVYSNAENQDDEIDQEYKPRKYDTISDESISKLDVFDYGFEPKVKFEKQNINFLLKEEQILITQHSRPEYPGTGEFIDHWEPGMYNCVVCQKGLFSSRHKYRDGNGYAAFDTAEGKVYELDKALESIKVDKEKSTHAKCENCGAYLGNIYINDPNSKTGKSYQVNSGSLLFELGFDYIPM